MTLQPWSEQARMLRAIELIGEYTLDISAIAARTLGSGTTSNRDVQLVAAIHRWPGSTPSSLAERLGIHRPAVSRTAGRLERAGLVHRDRDRHDGRSVRIELTGRGRSAVRAFEDELRGHVATAAPSLREIVALLGHPGSEAEGAAVPATMLQAADRLAEAGIAYRGRLDRIAPGSLPDSRYGRIALPMVYARGEIRPVALASALRLSGAATSEEVTRLCRQGLTYRRRPSEAEDGRAVLVGCTERGRTAVAAQLLALQQEGPRMAGAFAAALAIGLAPGPGVTG